MGELAEALGGYLDAAEARPGVVNRVARHLRGVGAGATLLVVVGVALTLGRGRGENPNPDGGGAVPPNGGPRSGETGFPDEKLKPKEPPAEVKPPVVFPPNKRPFYVGEGSWAVGPDDRTLVNYSHQDEEVAVWDAATGKKHILSGHSKNVKDIAFSPDGKTLAVASYKQVKVWDLATGKDVCLVTAHDTYVEAVSFAPHEKHGLRVLSVDLKGKAVTVDAGTGQVLKKVQGPNLGLTIGGVFGLFSPDARTFVVFNVGGFAGPVFQYDTTTWEHKERRVDGSVGHATFAPDGNLIFLGVKENVELFDLGSEKGEAVHKLHTEDVWTVRPSPDGKLVASGGKDKVAIVWDLGAKKERARLTGFAGPVSVRFSPDGRTVVATSVKDRQVRRYDLVGGKELPPFGDHKAGVRYAFFCRGGKTLVAVDDGANATLYDVAGLPE